MLTEEARRILLVRCANHAIGYCARCDKEWFSQELRAQPGEDGQDVLCRICGTDLTPSILRHLFVCLLTATREVEERERSTQRERSTPMEEEGDRGEGI